MLWNWVITILFLIELSACSFTYLYLHGLMVFYIVQWVIVVLRHFYLFWYLYWSWLGHAGTTTPMDTLVTLLKLLQTAPSCPSAQMPSQSTGALAPRSGPLQLPQTGMDACLTLFHLMALGRKGWKEWREGEGKWARVTYNKQCSFKILQLKKKCFFPLMLSQFHIRKTSSHPQAIQISIWA